MMKEQLVEMTGLSPRVIRVWFQNKRCKDKKKSMMLNKTSSHLQHQGPGSDDGQVIITLNYFELSFLLVGDKRSNNRSTLAHFSSAIVLYLAVTTKTDGNGNIYAQVVNRAWRTNLRLSLPWGFVLYKTSFRS